MSGQLTVKDLLEILEGIAPVGLAEQWDNVGLMIGKPGQEVSGLLLALDPTEEVLAEAKELGVNAIITHHPLIFHPLKAIYTDQPLGRFLQQALASEISVVGCHTNLDQAVDGVNDVLAASLGINEPRPLVPAAEPGNSAIHGTGQSIGFGRLGNLTETLSGEAFIEKLSEAGAQVYVTGEVKHSTARWAEAAGFCIIDGGHFATEKPVVESLADNLRRIFTARGLGLAVLTSAKQKNPFVYYQPQGS
jgi:putative NIF3 family GTP cyclohydrolase 1 type 2